MLLSKVFSSAGLLFPLVFSPFLAFLLSVDLGTLLMLEHSSGSLLVPGGLVAFFLLAQLEGDNDNRAFLVGCLLFTFAVLAFVARGAILCKLATLEHPEQSGLDWIRAALIVVAYLVVVICHFRFVMKKPEPEVPETTVVLTFG